MPKCQVQGASQASRVFSNTAVNNLSAVGAHLRLCLHVRATVQQPFHEDGCSGSCCLDEQRAPALQARHRSENSKQSVKQLPTCAAACSHRACPRAPASHAPACKHPVLTPGQSACGVPQEPAPQRPFGKRTRQLSLLSPPSTAASTLSNWPAAMASASASGVRLAMAAGETSRA